MGELDRYSRQMVLEGVGEEGQNKLLDSKVLVIGAGGLGSSVMLYLAATGLGTIGVADFDEVEITNLNRQIIHYAQDIGRKKVESAKDKLLSINPDITIKTFDKKVTVDNMAELADGFDIVIDASDNLPTRYVVSDSCYFIKKPLVEGAAMGYGGIVTTIVTGKSPCYRCLYPEPPKGGLIPTPASRGILGAAAGTIGTLMAMEAVKLILGVGDPLIGRLLSYDGLKMEFQEIVLKKSPDCPLCGEKPTILLSV